MNNKISIGIIGGGIAGLVFANFLKNDKKFHITIFEKNKYLNVSASGIQLSNNATRILNKIKFNEIDKNLFSKIEQVRIYDYQNKNIISKLSLINFSSNFDYLCLDRNVLVNFLTNQITENANLFHRKAVQVKNNHIVFADGYAQKFDFIIVADGMFSKIRNQIYKSDSLQKKKITAYKGLLHNNQMENSSNVELFLGNNKHFVFYPINKKGDFSFTGIFNLQPVYSDLDYHYPGNVSDLLKIAGDAHDDIKQIISLAKNIYQWPIYTHSKIEFGKKNIFIIGDSSHAMVPFHAQGAAQSIEDAYCLAKLFQNNIFSAEYFRTKRLSRVSMIISKSNQNLFTYHLSNPFMKIIRNFFIKIVCRYSYISNLFFGKIFNYDFKN